MTICVNCGREIKVIARNCPYCNKPIGISSVTTKDSIKRLRNDYDHKSNRLFLLSVFIPFLGLILYKIKVEEEHLKATSALSGFFVGSIMYLFLLAVILMINIIK